MENQEKSNFFKNIGYNIYRDFSKPSNKGFILYTIKNKNFTYNLSNFDVYDLIRDSKPMKFLKALGDYDVNNGDKITQISNHINKIKDDAQAKSFLINFHELFYSLFKNLVNNYKIIVHDTDYKPIDERIIIHNEKKFLNLYNKAVNINIIKPNSKAKFEHIEFIIKNICGSEETYNYFNNFLAYKLQNPLDVPPCHIIIKDDGGTGKSVLLLGDILVKIFEVNVITQNDLMSDFNSFMVGSSIVWCEEVEGFEDEKRLKALTGAKWINLNEKFEKNKKVRNYNNFIVASNELRVLKLNENNRRWSMIGGGKRLAPLKNDGWNETAFVDRQENEKFFRDYYKNLDHEINEYISYLLSIKVTRNDVQIPLSNGLIDELIDLNKTSEISFIDDIIEMTLTEVIRECYPNVYDRIQDDLIFYKDSEEEGLKGYWVKVKGLYDLYIQYCLINQYHKKLSKKMFVKKIENYKPFNALFGNCNIVRTDGKTYKSYMILNNSNH